MKTSLRTISPLLLSVLFFYSAVNEAIILIGGGKSHDFNYLANNNNILGAIIPRHGQSFYNSVHAFLCPFIK